MGDSLLLVLGRIPFQERGHLGTFDVNQLIVEEISKHTPVLFIEPCSLRGVRGFSRGNIVVFKPIGLPHKDVDQVQSKAVVAQIVLAARALMKARGLRKLRVLGLARLFAAKLEVCADERYACFFGDTFFPAAWPSARALDHVFCVNYEMTRVLAKQGLPATVDYSPMVVSPLEPGAVTATRPQRRVCFLGNVTFERLDVELLAEVCRALSDHEFAFFGSFGREYDAMLFESRLGCLGNVSRAGAFRYDATARFLEPFSHGLIPFLKTSFNLGCFPTKLFDYLKYGLHVHSPDLGYEHEVKRFINCYDGAAQLIANIRAPKQIDRGELQRFLAKHTVQARAAAISERLGL